jgi:hypothetical protein
MLKINLKFLKNFETVIDGTGILLPIKNLSEKMMPLNYIYLLF